ncbi:MAG: hypothetical protein WKG07_37060 [Hymenobacter sp.]
MLTTEGHENKRYVLTNTEATSFTDVAKDLSAELGKEIRCQSPPVAQFQAILKQARRCRSCALVCSLCGLAR